MARLGRASPFFALDDMDAITLWAELQALHPERTARVSKAVGPIYGDAGTLVARLHELNQGASIANGRCGYIGNPYEQVAEDFAVLVCVAERES